MAPLPSPCGWVGEQSEESLQRHCTVRIQLQVFSRPVKGVPLPPGKLCSGPQHTRIWSPAAVHSQFHLPHLTGGSRVEAGWVAHALALILAQAGVMLRRPLAPLRHGCSGKGEQAWWAGRCSAGRLAVAAAVASCGRCGEALA